MVFEHERDHGSQWATIISIASKIGCTAETLRKWVRQAERAQGSGCFHILRCVMDENGFAGPCTQPFQGPETKPGVNEAVLEGVRRQGYDPSRLMHAVHAAVGSRRLQGVEEAPDVVLVVVDVGGDADGPVSLGGDDALLHEL